MDDDLLVVIVVIIGAFFSLQKERIRQHNSILAGNLRYWEVIRHGNLQYFFNHCGMTKPVFLLLLRKLTSEMGQLCDGTKIDFRNLKKLTYIHPYSKNENENYEPYLACDLEQTYLIYGSLSQDQSHIYSAEGIFRLRVEGKYRSWRQLWPQL